MDIIFVCFEVIIFFVNFGVLIWLLVYMGIVIVCFNFLVVKVNVLCGIEVMMVGILVLC